MTDRSHDITTSESAGAMPEQVTASSTKVPVSPSNKCAPKYDKAPGWELRLFIRALLAQNLPYLLELTGHTQHELQLYTGLSKQTVITACSVKPDLSNMGSAFNSNTFVLSLCLYVDSTIFTLNRNSWDRERIVLKLLDRNSENYAALSAFLQNEGLTPEQIDTYTRMLTPQLRPMGHDYCPMFFELWTTSFEPSEEEKIARELKGLRFKDALLGTCGADSFDFTKARNVYFDLVFLRQADLGSDIFMRPLLHCLKQNKVRCLFDFEQLDRLYSLVKYDWERALSKITSYRDDLSDPNIAEHKDVVSLANQQLQFILLFSKLLRNLAILRKLELVPYRDKDKERPIDLLLSQKFAAKDYLEQAKKLIKGIIFGLNSLTKRREINLDSARSFLQSLDGSCDDQYYIFTASNNNNTIDDCDYWTFNGIYPDPHYNLDLRNDNGYMLFCKAKESGLVQHKDIHVLQYQTSLVGSRLYVSRLYLVKPYDKSQHLKRARPVGIDDLIPLPLFQGSLDTYLTDDGFEVDKTQGGAKLLSKLQLSQSLKSVFDQLPDTYYGTVLPTNNGGSRHIKTSAQKQQEHNSDWAAKLIVALDKILARGGFEG